MKLLTRMTLLFLTAAYARYHSKTDIAYPVAGGNIYFDAKTGTDSRKTG